SYSYCLTHTPDTYPHTLSLHDALPISSTGKLSIMVRSSRSACARRWVVRRCARRPRSANTARPTHATISNSVSAPSHIALRCQRSEEHTSELQSRENLVCRLLLEKKKK